MQSRVELMRGDDDDAEVTKPGRKNQTATTVGGQISQNDISSD